MGNREQGTRARRGFVRPVWVGIAILALTMAGFGAASLLEAGRFRDRAGQAARGREVIAAIAAVRFDTVRLQADLRAFLVTGFDNEIALYRASAARLRATAAALARLTAADPDHRARAAEIEREIAAGIAGFDGAVALRGGPDGHAAILELSKQRGRISFVDPLLDTLAEADGVERERLADREAEAGAAYRRSLAAGLLAAALGLAALGLLTRALARVMAESDRRRRIFDTALSNTADFIYLFDLAGRFTYVNKSLLDLWGKGLSEATGRTFRELEYPPELAARFQRQIAEVVRTRRPLRDETPYASAAGTRAYEYIFVPVFGAGGAVEAVAGSTRDITERKRAEASLAASEERYRVLATATSDVVYRMSADWSEMQPLDGRRLVPSTAAPVRDWMARNLPASEHERVRAGIARAVANRQPFEMEHQVTRPDGTLGWTLSRAVPIPDADGGTAEWFGTARDVTERRRAEDALEQVTAESERRKRLYETALSNTPDLVYVFDLDHRFVYANEALLRLWGRTWDEAIGRNCLELGYEGWHASMHDREIEQVRATGRPIRGEVPFVGTLGRRTYDYIFVPVFGADGQVEAVAGTTRDVTERKGLEDALREADRKKDDFIALLAHELRNPLAPIRNGLQVIRLSNDRTVRERSQGVMDRQLAHMVRLIDDLLDVSRIGRNKMELRRARVALADVIDSAVETARPMIDETGHELTVALPPGPVFLDADLTRLSQVFSNLLTNSAKYTERGGRVWVSAEARDGQVTVTVRDTGLGIPADALPTIFDMFSQVDRSVERSTGGLGIGLALVKGLTEMHGGTVTARSDGPGAGSTFAVTLPVRTGELPPTAPAAEEVGRTPAPKRRVLVVDDNRDGAESLAMVLELLGNDVATAHDGLRAVEEAERFRPEVILMDVGMPRLNGLDATRRIRERQWAREVTIIALTGWGQDGDRERSREAGCDGHLVKPVAAAELEALLTESRRGGS